MNPVTHTPHGLPRASDVYQKAALRMFHFCQSEGMSFDQSASLARLHPWYATVTLADAKRAIKLFRGRQLIKHPHHAARHRSQRLDLSSLAGKGRRQFLDPHQ